MTDCDAEIVPRLEDYVYGVGEVMGPVYIDVRYERRIELHCYCDGSLNLWPSDIQAQVLMRLREIHRQVADVMCKEEDVGV